MIYLAKEEQAGRERSAMLIAYFIEKIWRAYLAPCLKTLYDKHSGSCLYLIKY